MTMKSKILTILAVVAVTVLLLTGDIPAVFGGELADSLKHRDDRVTHYVHLPYAFDSAPNLIQLQYAIDVLNGAKEGELVFLEIKSNLGGYVSAWRELNEAINATKATVVTRLQRGAYSAGAMSMMSGDIAVFHAESVVMFHVFRNADQTFLLTKPSALTTPQRLAMYYFQLKIFEDLFLPYLTKEQQKQMLEQGKDIYIFGLQICQDAKKLGKNTDIIIDLRTKRVKYCIVEHPNFEEKKELRHHKVVEKEKT